MAKAKLNSAFSQFSGSIGRIVFKQTYHTQMRDAVRAEHYRARAKQEKIPVSSFGMGGFMKHGPKFSPTNRRPLRLRAFSVGAATYVVRRNSRHSACRPTAGLRWLNYGERAGWPCRQGRSIKARTVAIGMKTRAIFPSEAGVRVWKP